MRQRIISLLCACMLITFSCVGQAATEKAAVDLTFNLSAQRAKLFKNSSSNSYRLLLTGVAPYITYITGRPGRVKGLASIENFIRAWGVGDNSFAKDNPNAILYAGVINAAGNNGNQSFVIQVDKPEYDKKRGIMQFEVEPLGSSQLILEQMDLQYVNLVIN